MGERDCPTQIFAGNAPSATTGRPLTITCWDGNQVEQDDKGAIISGRIVYTPGLVNKNRGSREVALVPLVNEYEEVAGVQPEVD